MTLPRRYPGSIWKPIPGKSGFSYQADRPWRLVLHSTETRGLPNYRTPPHMTINPLTNRPLLMGT